VFNGWDQKQGSDYRVQGEEIQMKNLVPSKMQEFFVDARFYCEGKTAED